MLGCDEERLLDYSEFRACEQSRSVWSNVYSENGAKPLPKDIVAELLHLSTEELVRRFTTLNYFDGSAIVEVLVRLLDNISISPLAKNELLIFANNPETKFHFISKVFLAAIKNPTKVSRLTKAEKAIIKCCRDNTPVPDDEEQVPIADSGTSHFETPSPLDQVFSNEIFEDILKTIGEVSFSPSSPCLNYEQRLLTVSKWTPSKEDITQTIDYFEGLFRHRSKSVKTVLGNL